VAERREQADPASTLPREVSAKVRRKLAARRGGAPVVWSGLGTMGLVGWSIVIPTLAGAALGHWLDAHHPGPHGWTLALLVAGLTLGCFNAWHWIAREDRAMHHQQGDSDDHS
jgi:ATP synthase protein I